MNRNRGCDKSTPPGRKSVACALRDRATLLNRPSQASRARLGPCPPMPRHRVPVPGGADQPRLFCSSTWFYFPRQTNGQRTLGFPSLAVASHLSHFRERAIPRHRGSTTAQRRPSRCRRRRSRRSRRNRRSRRSRRSTCVGAALCSVGHVVCVHLPLDSQVWRRWQLPN